VVEAGSAARRTTPNPSLPRRGISSTLVMTGILTRFRLNLAQPSLASGPNTRPMAAASLRHLVVSLTSCLRPAGVSL